MQADITGLEDAIREVPQLLKEILDRRQMAGQFSLEAIMNPMMSGMASEVSALRRLIIENNGNSLDARQNSSSRGRPRHNMRLYRE